jgi:hypothetical protein
MIEALVTLIIIIIEARAPLVFLKRLKPHYYWAFYFYYAQTLQNKCIYYVDTTSVTLSVHIGRFDWQITYLMHLEIHQWAGVALKTNEYL